MCMPTSHDSRHTAAASARRAHQPLRNNFTGPAAYYGSEFTPPRRCSRRRRCCPAVGPHMYACLDPTQRLCPLPPEHHASSRRVQIRCEGRCGCGEMGGEQLLKSQVSSQGESRGAGSEQGLPGRSHHPRVHARRAPLASTRRGEASSGLMAPRACVLARDSHAPRHRAAPAHVASARRVRIHPRVVDLRSEPHGQRRRGA